MNSKRGLWIAGNWKMNHGPKATADFFQKILTAPKPSRSVQVSIFPPALSLASALEAAHGSWISIGSQNTHGKPSGAFTGEVSAEMIKELGCSLSLVGHSERRQHFGETDRSCGERIQGLLTQAIRVLFCYGETKTERESGKTEAVIKTQLSQAFAGVDAALLKAALLDGRLSLAYEPVWAIGTGLVATPEQAEAAHAYSRQELLNLCGQDCAQAAKILYGGSVTLENAEILLKCPNVDGLLIGGASLKPDSFSGIVTIASSAL